MAIKGINVAALFSRKSELATALQICARGYSDSELVSVLGALTSYHSTRKAAYLLHRDTIAHLWRPIEKVRNPLIRHVCVQYLSNLDQGSVPPSALALSYLATDCVEQAWPILSSQLDSSMAEKLLEQGRVGWTVLIYALRRRQWSPASAMMWNALFERSLDAEDYNIARYLWQHFSRPERDISRSLIERFMELVGKYSDIDMARMLSGQLGAFGDLELNASLVSSCLNCAVHLPVAEILSLLRTLNGTVGVADTRRVGEVLAADPLETMALMHNNEPEIVRNAFLNGIYRKYSSQTVLHVFRYMVNHRGFVPNIETFQILANAAFRLGNSKLLGYRIWHEFVYDRGVAPTRRVAETMLMCQLVGSGYRSSLYFLHEMYQRRLFLRGYVQRTLAKRFGEVGDDAFVALFHGNTGNALANYAKYNLDTARKESVKHWDQAVRNAEVYLNGRDPESDPLEVLQKMLKFDTRLE